MATNRVKKPESKVKKSSMADLRNKSVDELQKLLATNRADLLEAQKSLRANELANPHAVTKMKKEIARILTVLRELEINAKNTRSESQSSENNIKKASEAKPSTNSRAKRSGAPRTGAGEVL